MRINIFDEENLDLQDDEMNDEIYINPVVDEEDEQNEYETDSEYGCSARNSEITSTSDYKVSAITESFLRTELNIQCESNRTIIKFSYKDNVYKGIVVHKMNKNDYIFLVQDAKVRNSEKTLKKIHIPDASLIN